jgi:hypothetical protein
VSIPEPTSLSRYLANTRQYYEHSEDKHGALKISIYLSVYLSIYGSAALFVGLWPLFSFLILYTICRTPWTGDQSVAMLLPTHRTTQTQNKRTDIHASSGIRSHDPSVWAGKDSSYLRRNHRDQRNLSATAPNSVIILSSTFYSLNTDSR